MQPKQLRKKETRPSLSIRIRTPRHALTILDRWIWTTRGLSECSIHGILRTVNVFQGFMRHDEIGGEDGGHEEGE